METTSTSVSSKDMFDAIDGFDDKDLEKPNFGNKYSLTKVPFILSDPDKVPRVQVPATINQYLRKYQQEGIVFLYKQYCVGKGAILADDMGLGKTVQVIGFISAVLGKTGTKFDVYGKFMTKSDVEKVAMSNIKKDKGAFLIVSPHSVLYNWHDELMTWGHFKIGKFHKNKRVETLERATLDKLDVVLTTYETLRNHWESLNDIKWLAVIMDEVHHLKDPKAAVTIAAKSLRVKCRIGLTGTPFQNRFLDFWCVLDWANPGCIGEKEDFANCFGKPIVQGQRFDVTKRELATGRKKTQEFQSMIDEWCLRRTKAIISDQLPHKDQKVVFCPLSKLQEDIYKTLLQTPDVQIVVRQGEPCDCRSGLTRGICCYFENEEGASVKQLMMQYLRLFLKVANHAALLLPQVKQTEEQKKRATAICEKVFSAHPAFEVASKSPSFELFSDSNFCGKMKVLDNLLKLFKQQKDKVLLFSYSTQLLDMLEAYVISCGMVYRRLDGKTRGERRLRVVREFNTSPDIFVFLVSTKAGGVGLNLTGANVVIVFDPSWNPADDLQAEDRAYRIGQSRDVKVFRMISSGTIEENMYLRQVYKQQLANVAVEGNNERRYFTAVEGEKDKKGELFGVENLFALRNDGCSVTTDIFKRSDKIEKGFKMAKYELQPKHKEEDKPKSSRILKESDEVEEDQSYDFDEVTSQLVGDESVNDKMALSGNNVDLEKKNDEETASHYGDEDNNTTESCPETWEKVQTEKQTIKFTKVRNVSAKNKLFKNSSQVPRPEEEWKRGKNQKDTVVLTKTPKSKDSQVNQILVDCGVQHTYSNKLRIGTSKAEKEMTSRAMKEVFELGQFSQQPANCFAAAIESDSEESDDIGDSEGTLAAKADESKDTDKSDEIKDVDKSDDSISSTTSSVQKEMSVTKVGNSSVLFGETPRAIRLRQFMEISHTQSYESAVDLAKAVVSSNTSDRLNMLKEYYKRKDYPVDTISHFSAGNVQSSPETNTRNSETTKRSFKSESSLKLSRARRRPSAAKSYTKILKTPAVKTNGKKDGGAGASRRDGIKNITLASSSSLQDSCTDIPGNEKVTDRLRQGDNTGNSDENREKSKSPSPHKAHQCTIPSEIIEKTEGDGAPIPDPADFYANRPAAQKTRFVDIQPVSVLDEFLCESSQRNDTKTDENSENVQPHFLGEVSRRNPQRQTSILDDLI